MVRTKTKRTPIVRDQIEPVDVVPEKSSSVLEKLTPILLVASIFLAFAVGVLWQKVQSLESGGLGINNVNQQAPGQPTNRSGKLSEDRAKAVPKISDNDHLRGSKDAKVIFIEYSDYQCPYCKEFHPTAQKIADTYGDDIVWIYRHFPLDQIHPNARPAAEASECVASLGGNDAFWKFTDLLFSDQTYLANLQGAAEKSGVNGAAFKSCYDSGKFKKLVEQVYQDGMKAGVTGTPANFIINRKGEAWLVPGALPFEQLKATIDEALKS